MKRGLKPLIAGAILFMIGTFLIPMLLVFAMGLKDSSDRQFIVPGSHEVVANKPGRHYVWNDYQTVYQGQAFNRPKQLPDGYEIVVTDDAGNELTFTPDTSTTIRMSERFKKSIGYVEVAHPGTLNVSVSGNPEERVFSFAPSIFTEMLLEVAVTIMASLIITCLGLGIAIWGIVQLANQKKSA